MDALVANSHYIRENTLETYPIEPSWIVRHPQIRIVAYAGAALLACLAVAGPWLGELGTLAFPAITWYTIALSMACIVIVAVERRVRNALYGKIQRRTSTFMAHDESNDAKVGDRVAMVESRPLSKRKRFVVTRVVSRAGAV